MNLTGEALLDHVVEADRLHTQLDRLGEDIGRLDDVVESPLIDCRIRIGAYQHIQRALDALGTYKDYLENDVDVSLSPTVRDI